MDEKVVSDIYLQIQSWSPLPFPVMSSDQFLPTVRKDLKCPSFKLTCLFWPCSWKFSWYKINKIGGSFLKILIRKVFQIQKPNDLFSFAWALQGKQNWLLLFSFTREEWCPYLSNFHLDGMPEYVFSWGQAVLSFLVSFVHKTFRNLNFRSNVSVPTPTPIRFIEPLHRLPIRWWLNPHNRNCSWNK